MSAGDAEKAKGNAEFSAGNYDQAIVHFTAAIGLGATHVLYSNRSACYCGLRKYEEALSDVRAEPNPPRARHPERLTRTRAQPTQHARRTRLHVRMRTCVRCLRACPRLRVPVCLRAPVRLCACHDRAFVARAEPRRRRSASR